MSAGRPPANIARQTAHFVRAVCYLSPIAPVRLFKLRELALAAGAPFVAVWSYRESRELESACHHSRGRRLGDTTALIWTRELSA